MQIFRISLQACFRTAQSAPLPSTGPQYSSYQTRRLCKSNVYQGKNATNNISYKKLQNCSNSDTNCYHDSGRRNHPTHHNLPHTTSTTAPKGPSSQYLRTLVQKTRNGMDLGTRNLKHWVLGPGHGHRLGTPHRTPPPGQKVLRRLRDSSAAASCSTLGIQRRFEGHAYTI